MSKCLLCGKTFKVITNTHLKAKHGLSVSEYKAAFPGAIAGFSFAPNKLDRKDPRFVKWRQSLRGRTPWNKGLTKEVHPSLSRLSKTMASRNQFNFSSWLEEKRKIGSRYLVKSEDLAELIGVMLGDGCIEKFPRTERLYVSFNSKDNSYIKHVATLLKKIFQKEPSLYRSKAENSVRLSLYQNNLSERLEIPTGNKIKNDVKVPKWIKGSKAFTRKCLKGLFETDGSFVIDSKNYTYVIEFKNKCSRLLTDVCDMLNNLGFHPQKGKTYVRMARKAEVNNFISFINFRNLNNSGKI